MYHGYWDYIESIDWAMKRAGFLEGVTECEKCGKKKRLTVHHKNYKNLYKEERKDVSILCWKCHKGLHRKKKKPKKKAKKKLKKKPRGYVKTKEIPKIRFSCATRYSKDLYAWGKPRYG